MPFVNPGERHDPDQLHVVLFSGGRGSAALARQLVASSTVRLTIVINGYDDGASTGEVRRFLGDSLGPSDFRKNASNLAATLRSCATELVELLDLRMPVPYATGTALALLRALGGAGAVPKTPSRPAWFACSKRCPLAARAAVGLRLQRFAEEVESSAPAVRLRRLQPGQPGLRRRISARGARLQPGGG